MNETSEGLKIYCSMCKEKTITTPVSAGGALFKFQQQALSQKQQNAVKGGNDSNSSNDIVEEDELLDG